MNHISSSPTGVVRSAGSGRPLFLYSLLRVYSKKREDARKLLVGLRADEGVGLCCGWFGAVVDGATDEGDDPADDNDAEGDECVRSEEED